MLGTVPLSLLNKQEISVSEPSLDLHRIVCSFRFTMYLLDDVQVMSHIVVDLFVNHDSSR